VVLTYEILADRLEKRALGVEELSEALK